MLGFKGFATAAITDRRYRIDASHPQGTIRTGTIWLSKVDLRLQCGMPCSKLEVSTVQHGTLSAAGYLHQSPTRAGSWGRARRRSLGDLCGGTVG